MGVGVVFCIQLYLNAPRALLALLWHDSEAGSGTSVCLLDPELLLDHEWHVMVVFLVSKWISINGIRHDSKKEMSTKRTNKTKLSRFKGQHIL